MNQAKQAQQLKGEAKLRAELAQAYKDIESLSPVELAARNPQLAEFIKHWEDRATRAEAKVAALESQEPIGIVAVLPNGVWSVGWGAGHVPKHNDKLYLAPGAAHDMSRDHYWSKVDARCKELEAKVAAMESQLELSGKVSRKLAEHCLAPGAAPKECVCGEPETPGTHRTDGPCYIEFAQAAPAAWEPDMPKIGCVQHDCDECKARPAQKVKIVVGKYTLSQGRMKGRVWIEHESGEGGDFEVERWYKENF